MTELGKALIGFGLLILFIGAVLLLAGRIGLPLGRLPGDVTYKSKNVSVYFPLGTSILISIMCPQFSMSFRVFGGSSTWLRIGSQNAPDATLLIAKVAP